jgi:ADP-ribose pyrophosphatase YjhB (NUDIX family)
MTPREAHRFCPSCGAAASPGNSGPFDCNACGLHLYFNPAVAAAAFVRRADGRWLFIRRARNPGLGRLAPPGGFIDMNETAEDAVRREVREEVGLELAGVRFLASHPNHYEYRGVNYPVLDLFFTASSAGGTGTASDEVAGLEWLSAQEVAPESLAFPSMQAAWRQCLAEGR